MKLIVRWVVTVIALWVAVQLVPGINVESNNAWIAFFVMALVLGLVNVFVKPLLTFLSCGFIILTMGLFLLVINAGTLWLSSWILQNWLNIGFVVDGFWSALIGSIIVSLVSFFLSIFLSDDKDRRRRI
jgi:putative membrane protein